MTSIFNSRLHFIGDGRGTVVDTEIVQRLGSYFPGAGGQVLYSDGEKVDNNQRDLQVTTLDRYTGTIADPEDGDKVNQHRRKYTRSIFR